MQRHPLIKYKFHHLFFWMLVFAAWYFLRVDDYSTRLKAFQVTAIKVTELALVIYITNYILIPRLLYKKKYGWFALVFVAGVFGSTVIKMQVLGRLLNAPSLIHWEDNLRSSLYNNIIPHFFLVIAGAAVKLLVDYGKLQQRMAETAKEKAEAELNFLKSQINPHFLFNSLNSVYFLIHKDNPEARGALHTFAEMLRYQLYEIKDDRIPVEKEIQYLGDYMDLQQLRKDGKYQVELRVAPDVSGFSIEPLLLIPFVENAFKHISHYNDKSNFVKVDMKREGEQLVFTVVNSREAHPVPPPPGGIGLNNVRRRLELLYPGRHELIVDQPANQFSVQLKLQLS